MAEYLIIKEHFSAVKDVKAWLEESTWNATSTPQLVLWGVLQSLKPWEQLTKDESTFITQLGLSIITAWKEESRTKHGADLRKMLIEIGQDIESLSPTE